MRIMQLKQEIGHNGLNAQNNVAFGYTKPEQTDAFLRQAVAQGRTTQTFLDKFDAMCARLRRNDIILGVQDGSAQGCDILLTIDYANRGRIPKPFNDGRINTAFQRMFNYLDDIRNVYRDVDPKNMY